MTILARPGVKSPRYMYLGGHVHGIYSFSKGLPGLHDYEFSFTFRCAEVEEILEKIVKFGFFGPGPWVSVNLTRVMKFTITLRMHHTAL